MIDDRVNVILLDNNCGALFVGTKHGLSKCPLGTNPPPCYNLNTSNNSNFPGDDVTAIELGCDGKIWVGTRSSGIGVFEISTPPPAPSSISITRITALPSDSITVLALDSACNILAGSADGNIAEISADTLKLIDIVKGTTSIRDINSESFSVKVYPQPSSNQINFVSEQTIKNGEFSLFDITERTQQQISLGNTNRFATDVNSLQNGIYFYRIISDKQIVKTGKVQVLK